MVMNFPDEEEFPMNEPYPPDPPYGDDGEVAGGPAGGPVPWDTPTGPEAPPPDYGNFDIPQYGGPSSPIYNFQPPPEFGFPDFMSPSFADAQNEPGYQFRLQSGVDALQNSAAARGVLRTGGTLKDILSYGQRYGQAEYANLFNRAMQAYGLNRETAMQRYAPQLQYIQMLNGAERERAMAEFQRYWDSYLANLNAQMTQEGWIQNLAGGEPPPLPPQQ